MTKQFLLISFLFSLHHPLLADERKAIFNQRSFHDSNAVRDAKEIKKPIKDTSKTMGMNSFIKDSNLSTLNLSPDTFMRNDPKQRADGEAVAKKTLSKEFGKSVKNMQDHVLHDKRLDWTKALDIKNQLLGDVNTFEKKGELNSDERLFVIVSSSMPSQVIKNYLQRLEPIAPDTVFVLRGAIGGAKKIMPTLNWIQRMKKYGDEKYYQVQLDINPNITRRYKIERVPAVVFVTGFNESNMQNNGSDAIAPVNENINIVYGAIDPAAALREIQKNVKNDNLEYLIKKIEGVQ